MRGAQHAPALDAHPAGDQVGARSARLALSAHLRGEEQAKRAHPG
jgi:ribulose 1,5-bisphosphate carboxylase large subunit-like protein